MTDWTLIGIYGLATIGAFCISGIVVMVMYLLIDKIIEFKLKRNIPKDKKDLLDPGKPAKEDERRIIENDRNTNSKYREYERIRRIAAIKEAVSDTAGINGQSERTILQNELASKLNADNSGFESNSRKDNTNTKSFKFIEPVDF